MAHTYVPYDGKARTSKEFIDESVVNLAGVNENAKRRCDFLNATFNFMHQAHGSQRPSQIGEWCTQ